MSAPTSYTLTDPCLAEADGNNEQIRLAGLLLLDLIDEDEFNELAALHRLRTMAAELSK